MQPRIRLLGSRDIGGADGQRIVLPTRKAWGLLAYLAQSQAREVPREELAALLWPRAADGQARASLRQELAVLRKSLTAAGVGGIAPGKDHVRFAAPPGRVDTVEMERLLDLGDYAAWRGAAALYRGDFLFDLRLRSGPFEEWLWIERQRLRTRVVAALQRLLEHDLAGDDPDRAIASAERLLAVEPVQEQAYRALMRLYRRRGQRADALQIYGLCREILRRELDTVPSAETTILADRIRDETASPPGAGQSPPRRAHLVVLALGLAGPRDLARRRDPEALAAAQERFGRRVARMAAACGGTMFPTLGDRWLAVFGDPAAAAEDGARAMDAALSICAEPVSLTDRSILWPRAGLDIGAALIAPPEPGGGAVLAGDVVLRAGLLAERAHGGQVVAARELTGDLGAGFELSEAAARPDRLADPGRVVRRAESGP